MTPLINWLVDFIFRVFTISSYSYVKHFQIYDQKCYLTNLLVGFFRGGTGYIQIFDTTTKPQDGDIPMFSKRVVSSKDIQINLGSLGMHFENGIWVVGSSERTVLQMDGFEFFLTATYRI